MTKQDGRFSTVIRKSIRKLFFREANKGRLVNDLLEEHYKKNQPTHNKESTKEVEL